MVGRHTLRRDTWERRAHELPSRLLPSGPGRGSSLSVGPEFCFLPPALAGLRRERRQLPRGDPDLRWGIRRSVFGGLLLCAWICRPAPPPSPDSAEHASAQGSPLVSRPNAGPELQTKTLPVALTFPLAYPGVSDSRCPTWRSWWPPGGSAGAAGGPPSSQLLRTSPSLLSQAPLSRSPSTW